MFWVGGPITAQVRDEWGQNFKRSNAQDHSDQVRSKVLKFGGARLFLEIFEGFFPTETPDMPPQVLLFHHP